MDTCATCTSTTGYRTDVDYDAMLDTLNSLLTTTFQSVFLEHTEHVCFVFLMNTHTVYEIHLVMRH